MSPTYADQAGTLPRIVVDTSAVGIVREILGTLGVPASEESRHPELRLTRLAFTLEPEDSLDALLAEVRRRAAQGHGGWTPAIGKDREASSPMTTSGHSCIMSGGPAALPVGIASGHSRIMGLGAPSPDLSGAPGSMALIPGALSQVPGVAGIGYPVLTEEPTDSDDFHPPAGGGPRIGWVDTELADLDVPEGTTANAWEAHSAFVRDLIRQIAPASDEPILHGVLNRKGGRGDLWDVAVAMVDLVLLEKVDILLLPLATYTVDGLPPLLLSRAMEVIGDKCLIIAAAGNHFELLTWKGDRCTTSSAWPAAFPEVQAVGAQSDGFGPALPPWVDAFTPGSTFEARFFKGWVTIDDQTPDPVEFHGAARWAGTSFSAAHAAGLVAARMSATGNTAAEAWDALLAEGKAQVRLS